MATVRNCGFIALWLCAKLSPIQAQAVPEDALEKVRAELESGPVTLARRMTELTCLLRLDRQDEVPATARACAALLAPGRLAPALKGLAESTLGLEPALALVRTLCQRGRCDTALPILLALHREAPNDLRVLIALGEVLDPSSPLPDRELARTSLETALDLLDSPRSGALPAGTDLLRAVEYFSSPGNTNDLAALRDRVEADLVLVARGESLPRRTPSLAHCSEAIARLNSARERGDQVALVDSARQLASWLGGNPALAFVLGAALVSAGPACSRDEGKALLEGFLQETDHASFSALGLEPELSSDTIETLLLEVAGKRLARARVEARTALAQLTGAGWREPVFLYPDRQALPPSIAECDRKLAEFATIAKGRTEHQKELARWRKALSKDLTARGIGGQSADTIRDHIHVHASAIDRIDKRLAMEAADPQVPKWRARRAQLTQLLVHFDSNR